jgi:hypothetical protein
MDKKFIKRNKFDKLHIPTLLTIIELTKSRADLVNLTAYFNGEKGTYSPSKLKARQEELLSYAGYLEKIAETLKTI